MIFRSNYLIIKIVKLGALFSLYTLIIRPIILPTHLFRKILISKVLKISNYQYKKIKKSANNNLILMILYFQMVLQLTKINKSM